MPTQKQKFSLYKRLQSLGFSYEESVSLRRIEMTLKRWAEAERNGEIERDEISGIPRRRFADDRDKLYGQPIADREAGALKRLKAILAPHPELTAYCDPRGCALYILTQGSGESCNLKPGEKIESVYTRGLAVCAADY